MACRPFAFGARFSENGRSVRLRQDPRTPTRYAVEIVRNGDPPVISEHSNLAEAIRRFSSAWRARLN